MACKTYCVYKHVLPNNKIYIGITKQNPQKILVKLQTGVLL